MYRFIGSVLVTFLVFTPSALALGSSDTATKGETREHHSVNANAKKAKVQSILPSDRLGSTLPYSFFL